MGKKKNGGKKNPEFWKEFNKKYPPTSDEQIRGYLEKTLKIGLGSDFRSVEEDINNIIYISIFNNKNSKDPAVIMIVKSETSPWKHKTYMIPLKQNVRLSKIKFRKYMEEHLPKQFVKFTALYALNSKQAQFAYDYALENFEVLEGDSDIDVLKRVDAADDDITFFNLFHLTGVTDIYDVYMVRDPDKLFIALQFDGFKMLEDDYSDYSATTDFSSIAEAEMFITKKKLEAVEQKKEE